MLRRVPLPVFAILGVILLIVMIGGVTFFASNVIGETVEDQFQTQQVQIANSSARQVEAYFTELGVEMFQLSQEEDIQSTARSLNAQARIAIERNITSNGRRGIVENAIVFRVTDEEEIIPRYGWPDAYASPDELPYNLPNSLIAQLVETAESPAATTVYRVSSEGGPAKYVIVAPIETVTQFYNYIAYELNMEAAMADVLGGVVEDLEDTETGKVWVFEYEGNLIFQSGATLQSGTPIDVFSRSEIISITDTEVRQYTIADTEFNGTFSPAEVLDRRFIILVSRDRSEATSTVESDLQLIFVVAVAAVFLLTGMSAFVVRRLFIEIQVRQEQTSMQRATRTLLEVSRALNSTLNFEQVLTEILLELKRIVPYDSASIMLLNDRSELEVSAHMGGEEQHAAGVFSIEETSAAREVISTGRPVIIDDTHQDERWTAMSNNPIRSWMGLPLRMREEFVGVLNINSDHAFGFSEDDIQLAEAFSDQASVALQNARLHDRDVTRIERELTLARGIQSSLLPTKESFEIPQLAIAFESEPARQVSGDYFQLIPLPDGKYGVFVGDVSGKGMPAALIMAVITTALRDEVIRNQEPGALLNRLNERLLERLLQVQMNSALIAAVFDPINYEILIANAGMVQPYWRKEGELWDFVDIGGYPLGASQRTNYSHKTVKLPIGSMMVLFSDGIIEAQDSRGEFFGFERLEALLETLPHDIGVQEALDRILIAVKRHLGNQDAQDDMTVMVLRTLEASVDAGVVTVQPDESTSPVVEAPTNGGSIPDVVETTAPVVELASVPVTAIATQVSTAEEISDEDYIMPRENVEIFIPSILGFEKVARSAAEALAKQMGFAEEKIEDVKTAVAEAVMNAIEHGNLEDKASSVTVMFSASDDYLEIRVHDRGRQIIPNPLPPPGQGDSSRGWGIFFMKNLMDEFEISRSPEGNEVRMTIFVNSTEDATDESEPTSDMAEWVDQGE